MSTRAAGAPRLTRLALVLAAAAVPVALRGQAAADPSRSGALYQELARQDSVLFDAAFVTCDAASTNALLADDVEFYHDQTGFHRGAQVRDDFRRLAANCPRGRGVARVLVPGSLRVYPIHDYGAVQTGAHRFVSRGGGAPTLARFVHLWQKRPDGAWRLTRVLSFDHHEEAPRTGGR